MAHRHIAGIELGGTKCIAALGNEKGELLARATVPTTLPGETLPALLEILRQWRQDAPFAAMGIASFGPVCLDPAAPAFGHITSTPKAGWADTEVLSCLTQEHEGPFAFDTDVNGAALAEGRWGAARGLTDYAYVTVGTGVGVGLIVNGRPTRGLGHCELGHVRVPRLAGDDWPGTCPFHGDCVEGLASGPAITARLGEEHVHTICPDHPVWEGVAHALAQMCHSMILACGPRRIVFGGGVAEGKPHLLPMIRDRIEQSIAGYIPLPGEEFICPPRLGADAGPLGAIALGLDALGRERAAD